MYKMIMIFCIVIVMHFWNRDKLFDLHSLGWECSIMLFSEPRLKQLKAKIDAEMLWI